MRIVASVQRTTRGWRGIRWVDKKCTQRLNVALRQFERNDGWGNGEKDMGDFPPLSLVRSPPCNAVCSANRRKRALSSQEASGTTAVPQDERVRRLPKLPR
jgi:hypothetical protein